MPKHIQLVGSCLVLAAAVLCGCGTPKPSPFAALARPAEISGVYYNQPRAPGYGNNSLWQLLRPTKKERKEQHLDDGDEQATEARGRPDDRVEVLVADDGRVVARLLRDGALVGERTTLFKPPPPGGDHLRRKDSSVDGPLPLWWMTSSREVELGFDGEQPQRLLVTYRVPGATMFVVIMPIAGGGGGPAVHYLFEAVMASTTSPTTTPATVTGTE